MALIDFDMSAPNVFLDAREGSDQFDVLVWDQRTGMVTVFIESGWAFGETPDGEPDWSRSARTVEVRHQDRFIVHAANVPDDQPIPTVAELLRRDAKIIVGPDGEVSRRDQ